MASPTLQAAILEELLPTITKIRYAELASSMIILFDHVLTLDQEIELFWHAQWSLGKLLFLINRYYALCIVIFNNYGAALAASYVMGRALYFITAYAIKLPLSDTTVCVPFGLPSNFYAFWIPMLISESVLCGLALYRGFDSYRPGANVMQSGRRIIEILVRDSLSYFVIIFATYLMNTIIFLTRPGAEVEIPIGFAVALSSVMSSRLCLNVRSHIHSDGADCILSGSLPRSPPLSPVLGPSHPLPYRGRVGGTGKGFEPFNLDGGHRNGKEQEIVSVSAGSAESSSSAGHNTLGRTLSDVEMKELGIVRAPSTRHFRVVSVDRNENCAV
ncbi:hypothetical protein GSI_10610 [Ganoderma sinense ZZ0214-1]|uniref:DUF6533 domain-containing protein n=1 Tax=Ganoderma sinense ZZ0214-1 TaxID=1077348 RepID=A0A2G8S123_9APHY|nr:hypothetical protein GSI_10610 [Ganoderma sinense ZZ0214-1]